MQHNTCLLYTSTLKAFSWSRVYMIHNKIDIPLSQKFKGCSFGQYRAEHGMRLLDGSLLSAPHGITIINAASLDAVNTGFQFFWVTKFGATIS